MFEVVVCRGKLFSSSALVAD
eukprot:SAG31_NODE_27560_length_424_cov_0.630769_1_plen_20_part_01